ncbi:sugar-binding domain-containing protein [Brachybacterium sp. J144]|uniref:sugar-binding transcriptional regulator n=1 Tax=Brachybacterium sp. J144 TaxID=3116487 RepID=UPI002E7902AF|nr:sugar-binding domain-containing protein [Brachybacterium sp. J144]MEE1650308.1 sugar-binding domain-containing protein [Brachybacterium sp. J144]
MTPAPAQRERLADAAELYFVHDLKVEAVGRELGVSRSTVSRLLAQARAEGVVEFVIHRDPDSPGVLRQGLEERYGIEAVVADVDPEASLALHRLAVGRAAATLLPALLAPDATLAVSWGSTIEAVSAQLPHRRIPGLRVVQMHGSGNVASLGKNYGTLILDRFGSAFGAEVHLFPVPTIFDAAGTRRLMWQEGSIRRTLDLRTRADVLLASVGVPISDHPSRLYESGYLTGADMTELAEQRTVGNIASVFFRTDGSTDGIDVNERSSGMPFEELRRVPVRLFVAADAGKTRAVRAALEAGLITHLVVDRSSAQELLGD